VIGERANSANLASTINTFLKEQCLLKRNSVFFKKTVFGDWCITKAERAEWIGVSGNERF
jgi:hypothetical protein